MTGPGELVFKCIKFIFENTKLDKYNILLGKFSSFHLIETLQTHAK